MFPVNKTTLPNNVRVITQKVPNAVSVALSLWWAVGSRDENKANSGVNHFLEHMAFKGTAKRSTLDIARQIDRLGGNANAFTGKEYTCFHGRVLPADLEELLDLLLDIVLNPQLDSVELDRERGVILQEIAGMEDTPEDFAFVLLQEDFWQGHPLGFSILGRPETITGLTARDLRDYTQKHHVGSRLVISAAGNIEHGALLEMLDVRLSKLSANARIAKRTSPDIHAGARVLERDTEQEHLVLAMPALPASDENRLELALLNLVLGANMSSRLFQEVREKRGLAYAVYSFLQLHADSSMWGIYMGVPVERSNEALQVVKHELACLRNSPVSMDEFINARQSLKGGIMLSCENMENRAFKLARNEFIFGRHVPLEEVLDKLDKVDLHGLSRLAERLLAPDNFRLLALGPLPEGELEWK